MPMMPSDALSDRKVLLGMSGGVDSSVAAFLLQQQGWQVLGLSLLTDDAARGSIEDARVISQQLDIPWELVDVRDEFRRTIVSDFVEAYTHGRTPNPCILCNPLIKFRTLYAAADRLGCEAVATGHYAAITQVQGSGRYALTKSAAGQKDQTYFMYRLTQDQLARLIFPLSGMNKPAVREIADKAGLLGQAGREIAQKPDSQDNCFIPDGDYANFISRELGKTGSPAEKALCQPGIVVNTSGHPIGTHHGLIHYTLGQRKGFQVQTTDRLFVVGRDYATNTLMVGEHERVIRRSIKVVQPVYSGLASIQDGERLEARIRNSAREVPCTVYPADDRSLRVEFDQPVAAPAPGQSCVFYRDGLIMAGGFIAE